MRRGTFECYTGRNGKFFYRLKAGNGEVIAPSQGYTTARERDKAVSRLRRIAPFARTYHR